MIGIINYMQFCRLCLVKEKVNVPIFDNTNDDKQLFLKITQCLPVKVSPDDKLPKSICESCLQKVDSIYQFQNMTVNSEKQLVQWLKEVGIDISDKSLNQTRLECTNNQHEQHSIHTDIVLKQEQDLETLNANAHTYQNQSYQDYNLSFSQMAGDTGSAFSQSEVSQPTSDADESDRGTQPDNSEDDAMTGNRIAKEEVESEEDYDEAGDALEPTAFVGVPSTSVSDEERPGPSGLSKPGPNPGLYEMKTFISKQIENEKLLEDHLLDSANLTDPKLSIDQDLINLFSAEDDCSELLQDITTNEHFENLIEQHEDKQFTDLINLNPKCEINNTTQDIDSNVTKYKCDICGKVTKKKKQLNQHIKIHVAERRYECSVCNKKFLYNYEVKIHKRTHEKPSFECEICSRKFTQKSHLTIHRRRHLSEYTSYCNICDKGFVTLTSYNNHVNVTHNNIAHMCEVCGAKLSSKSALKDHLKTHYERERTEICEKCGKTFFNARNLRNHMKTHSLHDKFGCKVCGKLVSDKQTLEVHLRTHNGEKPLNCEICNKSFASKNYLTAHLRTHTGIKPHKCKYCEKCFSQRSSLTIHLRYHTGNRPYVCSTCGKCFVSRTHLNGHVKTHEYISDIACKTTKWNTYKGSKGIKWGKKCFSV